MKINSKSIMYIIIFLLIIFFSTYQFTNVYFSEPFKSIYLSIMYIILGILFLSYLNTLDKEKKDFTPYIDIFNRLMTVMIFVLLISPAILYAIILIFQISPNAIVPVSNEDTWISFIGSIIGGALTMIAVTFAFNLQKVSNEYDYDKTRMPKLIIESKNKKDDLRKMLFNYLDRDCENYSYFNLEVFIKNISEFTAQNITLQSCDLKIYDFFGLNLLDRNNFTYDESIKNEYLKNLNKSSLFGDYSSKLILPIKIDRKYFGVSVIENFKYVLEISFEYKSLFNRLTYNLNCDISFILKNVKSKSELVSLGFTDGIIDVVIQQINNNLNIVD